MENEKSLIISNFLLKHNFTTDDFCRIAGIDSITLKKFINHEHYVCLKDLNKIAIVLNVDVRELL